MKGLWTTPVYMQILFYC